MKLIFRLSSFGYKYIYTKPNYYRCHSTGKKLPANEIFLAPKRPIPPYANIKQDIEGDILGEYPPYEIEPEIEGDIPLTISLEMEYNQKYKKEEVVRPSTEEILFHAHTAVANNTSNSIHEELYGKPAPNPSITLQDDTTMINKPVDVRSTFDNHEKYSSIIRKHDNTVKIEENDEEDSDPDDISPSTPHPDIPHYNPRDDMYPQDITEHEPYNK